jgi:hypothetical protein
MTVREQPRTAVRIAADMMTIRAFMLDLLKARGFRRRKQFARR